MNETIFDTLIDSFISDKIGIAEHFLTESLSGHLRDNLEALYRDDHLFTAGTGNNMLALQNKLVRGDQIRWLDRKHNDLWENTFFDLVDEFVRYLNRTCYSGITGYEFHYTRYETGSFYTKHVDQFKNNTSRKYSMIFYLNAGWNNSYGGELRIHQGENRQDISPFNCKGVFFQSDELEHEVLPALRPRLSITGWLKV